MEGYQKEHIKINRPQLLKLTMVRLSLTALLCSKDCLSKPDEEFIFAATTNTDRAARFYDTVETRTNSYLALKEALREDGQTGAAALLDSIGKESATNISFKESFPPNYENASDQALFHEESTPTQTNPHITYQDNSSSQITPHSIKNTSKKESDSEDSQPLLQGNGTSYEAAHDLPQNNPEVTHQDNSASQSTPNSIENLLEKESESEDSQPLLKGDDNSYESAINLSQSNPEIPNQDNLASECVRNFIENIWEKESESEDSQPLLKGDDNSYEAAYDLPQSNPENTNQDISASQLTPNSIANPSDKESDIEDAQTLPKDDDNSIEAVNDLSRSNPENANQDSSASQSTPSSLVTPTGEEPANYNSSYMSVGFNRLTEQVQIKAREPVNPTTQNSSNIGEACVLIFTYWKQILLLDIFLIFGLGLFIVYEQTKTTSNKNSNKITNYAATSYITTQSFANEYKITERPVTDKSNITCPVNIEHAKIISVMVQNLSQYEAVMSISDVAAINLTVDFIDNGEWLNNLPMLNQHKILFLSLKGSFCFEMIIPLLKQAVCLTYMTVKLSHIYQCKNEVRTSNNNHLNVKLPQLRNLTLDGNNLDSYDYLFSEITTTLEMQNLFALTIDHVIINERNSECIMKTLSNLTNLVCFKIGAIFKTSKPIYNVSNPLVNVKSIVWNGYKDLNYFSDDDGSIYVDSDLYDTFPNLESFQNNIGFLNFGDKNFILWCKGLKFLNLGLNITDKGLKDLQIVRFLPNLNSVHLRLRFHSINCPPIEEIENLNISQLKTKSMKNATVQSNCGLDSSYMTSISYGSI